MGWASGDGTRAQVVAKKMKFDTIEGPEVVALKHHPTGNEDWFLYEVRNKQTGAAIERFIGLMIWDGRLHKEMDEFTGPHYYGCPVEWLDHVPEPESTWAKNWRIEVRARAAKVVTIA